MPLRGLPYQVSLRPCYAHGMLATGQQRLLRVVNGLYSDFGPMFNQILHTSAELRFQQQVAEVTALTGSA